MRNAIIALNLLLLAGLAVYTFTKKPPRQAYIINQKVFAGFNGKQTLEKKLNQTREGNKHILDSLAAQLQQRGNDETLIRTYQQTEENFRLIEQQLSDQYTADIWKRINTYLAAFGKEEGYDFILGASGDGSLMYASDAYNVTDEIVVYMNRKFEAGD